MREVYRWRGVLRWMISDVRLPHGGARGRGVVLWFRRPREVRAFMDALADGAYF